MNYVEWQPYLISAAIGLLVGIERERAHPVSGTIGVRTFVLISLLGALAGAIPGTPISLAISLFTLLLVGLSYLASIRGPDSDRGLTTEFAAALVFILSYLSHTAPMITGVLGPITAAVLFSKSTLHKFTRNIKTSEFQAALLLLLLATVVVNWIEDRPLDPWGVFNPKKFGMLIVVLGSLEFAGYFLTKIFGGKKSAVLLGFLGGMVSSTAVTLSCARASRHDPKGASPFLLSATSAVLASLLQVLVIVGLVSSTVLVAIGLPLAAVIGVNVALLAALARQPYGMGPEINLRSPLEWRGIVRLSFFFALILGVVALVNRAMGDRGSAVLAFIAGMFELHGITLADTTMYATGVMPLEHARRDILLAVTASLAAKVLLCWIFARNNFTYTMTALMIFFTAVLWGAAAVS